MGTIAGPNIVTDGLVVGYDTGYGIGDNDTNTRLYKGMPTTNLNADPYHTNKSAGDTITLSGWGGDTGIGSFEVNTSPPGGGLMFINNNTSSPEGSGGMYADFPETRFTLTNGVTYTRSWWAKADDVRTASAHICSCNRDSTNTYIVGDTVSLNTTWQRYSSTFTYTGPTSSDWQFRHINYAQSKIYIANVQLEVGSVASPFVNGTRSSTGSLIDLKRTTDIDLSYVSFDSTGQPEMDGTDDYIDLGADIEIADMNQGWTAEYVFNSDSASTLQHFNGCEEDVHNAGWLALLSSKLAVWDRASNVWKYGSTQFASDTWYHVAFVQETGTSMQFYVNGVAEGGNHVSFAWTADKSAFFARYIGKYEYGGYSRYWNGHIPIARLYNKPLTATEIEQNYNSLKKRFDI
jgi:hypothetical protein